MKVVLLNTLCCRHVAKDVTAGGYTHLLHGWIQKIVLVWSEFQRKHCDDKQQKRFQLTSEVQQFNLSCTTNQREPCREKCDLKAPVVIVILPISAGWGKLFISTLSAPLTCLQRENERERERERALKCIENQQRCLSEKVCGGGCTADGKSLSDSSLHVLGGTLVEIRLNEQDSSSTHGPTLPHIPSSQLHQEILWMPLITEA